MKHNKRSHYGGFFLCLIKNIAVKCGGSILPFLLESCDGLRGFGLRNALPMS
jgi:hypothetical protein